MSKEDFGASAVESTGRSGISLTTGAGAPVRACAEAESFKSETESRSPSSSPENRWTLVSDSRSIAVATLTSENFSMMLVTLTKILQIKEVSLED